MKKVTITNFLEKEETGYIAYWRHENKNKNTPDTREGLKVVEREILFAAKMMTPQLSMDKMTTTRKLTSETGNWHISGESAVSETIKGMGSVYKRQPELVFLNGVGAFPTSNSNKGGAARYTHITGTPLAKEVMEDFDFVPWEMSDIGEMQPVCASLPFPRALIGGTKGIGVGKSCYVSERKFEDIYNWSKDIIDKLFPDNFGSGFGLSFLEEFKKNINNIKSKEDMRNFIPEKPISRKNINEKIRSEIEDNINLPQPYNHTGAICEYDDKRKVVRQRAKIITEKVNGKTKYFIVALPMESSDTLVQLAVKKSLGDKMLDLIYDHSGEGAPLKLEIPKKIAEDESLWFSLKMKRDFTESYCFWDHERNTAHVYLTPLPLLIDWYMFREEVLSKKICWNISVYLRKIHNNNLIKQYFDLDQKGQIKTEADVRKHFSEEDTRVLINLPEKTYIKENVDKLQMENQKLENKIKDQKKNLENLKEFIFSEWLRIGEENKNFIIKSNPTFFPNQQPK